MLILITGVLNPFFFLLGSCFSCTENLDSIPRNTISTFTGFCAVSEFVGIFFLIAEDFFVFTGPEYEHFNFIWKAFLWAKGHFIACPSGFRDILKTNNNGGSLSLSHCAFVLLNLWKQRKLFWNKLDTIITRKMNSCLKSACLWWVFKSPVLIFLPRPPQGFFTKHFSYSSLHHDSYRGSIISSLHFLFHEPVSMFQILLNFSSDLIYPGQDVSLTHLFLRFQQGSCRGYLHSQGKICTVSTSL